MQHTLKEYGVWHTEEGHRGKKDLPRLLLPVRRHVPIGVCWRSYPLGDPLDH